MSHLWTLPAVGGYPVPEVKWLINALRHDVRERQPEAKFLVSFLDTRFGPAKATEHGLAAACRMR